MVNKDTDVKIANIILPYFIKAPKDESIRKLAIDMYLEGLGFRAIGRVLGIGHSTVYYWVKNLVSSIKTPTMSI